MIEFYYGVMGSGKSKRLIDQYNISMTHKLFIGFIACIAHYNDAADDNKLITTRDSDKTIKPAHIITPNFNLKRVQGFDILYIDEAHFLTPDAVRYLSNLDDYIECYGLLTDFTNKLFKGSQALLYYAEQSYCLPVQCDYCNRRATHNIRLVNGTRVFEGDQFVLKTDDNVEYKAVCGDCFKSTKTLTF